MRENASSFVSFLLISADQTRDVLDQNLRLLRQAWARFHGLYYVVVPHLAKRRDDAMFTIDCTLCGNPTEANMEMTGAVLVCPACQQVMKTPDCLEYVARKMQLPDDVPILQASTDQVPHARDLLVMLMKTIISAAETDEEPATEWSNETWAL